MRAAASTDPFGFRPEPGACLIASILQPTLGEVPDLAFFLLLSALADTGLGYPLTSLLARVGRLL